MTKFNKTKTILILIPFGLFALYLFWILIHNIDYSDSSFQRDHFKWKLERMKYQKSLCEFYNNKKISGTITDFESPISSGQRDILKIKLDSLSDMYGEDFFCNTIDYPDFRLEKNILELYLERGENRPKKFRVGAIVKKDRNSDFIYFIANNDTTFLKFYYQYDDEYKSCTDLDTMNIMWNFSQYQKYDDLSRRHRDLNKNTLEMISKIKDK